MRSERPSAEVPQVAYTGVDNLEVMQEAVNYNRFLLNTVRMHAPARTRVLDFGAGSGQFAVPLHMQGMNVTALEPDQSLQQRLRAQGLRVVGSMQQLADASFDYIYTLNVLEHIEDDEAALRILHAKLAPSGQLLIYVPAFPLLYTSMDAKVGHVRRYTRATLQARVKAAGFSVQRAVYADSLGFLATLLFKWLGSDDGAIGMRALKIYDRAIFPVSRTLDRLLLQRVLGKNLLLLARRS